MPHLRKDFSRLAVVETAECQAIVEQQVAIGQVWSDGDAPASTSASA
jgi:hypothetical protein